MLVIYQQSSLYYFMIYLYTHLTIIIVFCDQEFFHLFKLHIFCKKNRVYRLDFLFELEMFPWWGHLCKAARNICNLGILYFILCKGYHFAPMKNVSFLLNTVYNFSSLPNWQILNIWRLHFHKRGIFYVQWFKPAGIFPLKLSI